MVKQIIAMAAACVIFIPAYALSEEVKAEAKKNMDLIFRVGHIRGQPEKPSDPLVEREFKILNSDSTTVQVRTEEDFPQVLKAQQRLAIFLDELPAGKYLFRTIVAYGDDDVNVDPYAKREVEPPGLTVLFNGNIISRRDIRNGSLISGVIIPEWLEKGGNIIQIRNESHGPICFNWLSVKPYSAESLLCLSRTSVKKEKAVEQLPNEIQICYLNSGYDASLSFISEKSGLLLRQQTIDLPSEMIGTFNFEHEQDIREHYGKSSYVLLNGLTGWLYSGGTKINIVNIENSKAFFDDLTGKPKPLFYGLKRMEKLFEGTPQKIEFNVLPLGDEGVLCDTTWAGALNGDGVATLQFATRHADGEQRRIVCPLPWHGKTKATYINGVAFDGCPFRELDPLQTNTEILEIPSNAGGNEGLFQKEITLSKCLTIRLVKDGAKEPMPLNLFTDDGKSRRKHERCLLAVSEKQPDPKMVREQIRLGNGAFSVESDNYAAKIISATKGVIDGVKNVVPWDKESLLVEISYPEERKDIFEGVRLPITRGEEMSFWVFTRSEATSTATLQFLYDQTLCVAKLKTDKWQRVLLPSSKSSERSEIRLIGTPSLPEYKKGAKVSFEFNGFAAVGGKNKDGKVSDIAQVRVHNPAKDSVIILLGKPGDYAEYRYALKEPVDMGTAKVEKNVKGISITYETDAQIIEIKADFPKANIEVPAELLALLSDTEHQAIKDKGLTPLIILIIPEKSKDK